MQWYITGTICLYRRYIATSVTYIGSVASGTMPSVEACKAACDRDTISDCIGVVYQENSGKCTKFPDTSHLTKVASADSEFYERHCQFTAGISTWRLFLFKKKNLLALPQLRPYIVLSFYGERYSVNIGTKITCN